MMPQPPQRPTPVLTNHARERCAEMGISTKVAKAIYRHAEIIRPARMDYADTPRFVANYTGHPEFSVLFVEAGNGRIVVVTVLYRDDEAYEARKQSA